MYHLEAIGLAVPLKEKMLRRGTAKSIFGCNLNRAFQHIISPQHALTAMHFDTLVIAIGGATRIGNLTDFP
jgi:hypothetical protein